MKTSVYNLDQMIAKAMREAANVVFAAMPVSKDVNLTALQVYEHFTKTKANVKGMPKNMDWYSNISVCSGDGFTIGENAEIVVTVDTYTCKVYGIDIFRFVHIFERLASVKDRARFIYSVPTSEAAAVLNITVEKSAKDILLHAVKDNSRPVMNAVYIDFVNSNIVASDGHTMQVMKCIINGTKPDCNGVAIPYEIAKNAFAKREFVLTVDGDQIVCNNEAFEVLGRFPDYLSVWRYFRSQDDELITLAPNAWKVIASQAKTMCKQYSKAVFVFHALSGNHFVDVTVWDAYDNTKVNEFRFETANAVPASFGVGFLASSLLRFKGVESLQGLDPFRGVVISGVNYTGILMPACIDELPVNYSRYESENKGAFCPVDAWKASTTNEPVEVVNIETTNEPVEVVNIETTNEPVEVVNIETTNEPVEVVNIETTNEPVEVVNIETTNEPVEVVNIETTNEPVECEEVATVPRMSTAVFVSSFVAVLAAVVLAFVVFVVKPVTMPVAAVPVASGVQICEPMPAAPADVATVSEAADVVTIEAEINDVICTGSFDTYYNRVKEEIITNYRAVMKSQLQEIAANNNEVFAAIEAADVEPVAEEITPIYSNSEELEEIADTLTEEDSDTADTITEEDGDTQTESEGEIISYSCNGYTVLMIVTATPDGQTAINTYIEPIE